MLHKTLWCRKEAWCWLSPETALTSLGLEASQIDHYTLWECVLVSEEVEFQNIYGNIGSCVLWTKKKRATQAVIINRFKSQVFGWYGVASASLAKVIVTSVMTAFMQHILPSRPRLFQENLFDNDQWNKSLPCIFCCCCYCCHFPHQPNFIYLFIWVIFPAPKLFLLS